MNGTIIQAQTLELKKRLEESDEEMLVFAINEINKVKAKIAPGITKINCLIVEPLYSLSLLLITVHSLV